MAKFRRRPIEVEATRWLKDGDHSAVISSAAFGKHVVSGRQGLFFVNPGDWIIAELDGSGHYPCAPDVFAAIYEPLGSEI